MTTCTSNSEQYTGTMADGLLIRLVYRWIPSNELDAKSTTPLTGRAMTPTRPLPTPDKQQINSVTRHCDPNETSTDT